MRGFGINIKESRPRKFYIDLLERLAQPNLSDPEIKEILQTNANKFEESFPKILKSWANAKFDKMKPREAKRLATTIVIFSNLLQEVQEGRKDINIEIVIAGYEVTERLLPRALFAPMWAETQVNLATAYCERKCGDPAENIEIAIQCYTSAIEVFHSESVLPQILAWAQLNLGTAYYDRIHGVPEENRKLAIQCYQAASQVLTPQLAPDWWALLQNHLGNAYVKGNGADSPENLKNAICHYQAALEIHTCERFPKEWATVQLNLGNVYCLQAKYNGIQSLNEARIAFDNALQICTPHAEPERWIAIQNSMGNVYKNMGQAEEAIKHYRAALKQAESIKLYLDYFGIGKNLGDAAFDAKRWPLAIEGYAIAMQAIEQNRNWGITEQRRREILEETIDVYQKLVQAYLNTEQWDKAIETVERSKTRNLVELLANRELYPKGDLPQARINELDRLRSSITSLEKQLQGVIDRLSANKGEREEEQRRSTISSFKRQLQGVIDPLSANTGEREEEQRRSLEASRQRLQQDLHTSRQQLDELLARIKPIDPSFSLTQRVEPIAFSDIQALMDDRAATIEWYLTQDKIITFIITANSLYPLVEEASAEKLEALDNWRNNYLAAYSQKEKQQWQDDLAANLKKLAEILNIDCLLNRIEEIFDKQGGKCDRLVLVPYRFLHLFPFHALPLANGDLLMERFPRGLSYAPSMQLLQLTRTWSRPSLERFFSVKNPTEDLHFADLEVDTICRYFELNPQGLEKQQASKTALTSKLLHKTNVAHFSCHGYFDFKTPSQSALLLAGSQTANATTPGHNTDANEIDIEQCLTLADIFALDLRQCCLVVLSACETGISDPTTISDEYIGLPSGFLYAGSPCVVSSLWKVSDFSTAFLMIKFYDNLRSGDSVTVALNRAQLWLRDVTKGKLEEWIKETQLVVGPSVKMALRRRIHQFPNEEYQRFSEPFYWAAFCAIDR